MSAAEAEAMLARRFLAVAFCVLTAFLFTSTRAHAQSASSPDGAAQAHTVSEKVRLRFDLAGGPRVGSAHSERVSSGTISPALALDLGLQLGPHAAVFGRLEGGTLGLWSGGAGYLLSEWTPVPILSVASGIGYDAMTFLWPGCRAAKGTCFPVSNNWSAASVPLLLALNLGREHRLRVEAEGAMGYDPGTTTWGYHAFVTIGTVWR